MPHSAWVTWPRITERSEPSGCAPLHNGIAVPTAGDVFIDTDAGNGWTSVSAIAEVTPSGNVRAIWRS